MAREITTHRVNGVNEGLRIAVLDEPGPGGASHEYDIELANATEGTITSVELNFQKGGIKEAGVNGVTHEALLAIVADRLECFQAGPYACGANEVALRAVHKAMEALKARTEERAARGVEGTSQA
jgi:hypothetical protein